MRVDSIAARCAMSPSSSANRPCPRADRLASRTDIQHCRSTPQSSAAHRNSPTPERPMAPSDSVSVPEYRRSEEHTSELQSLMRKSYAVFSVKKKKTHHSTE